MFRNATPVGVVIDSVFNSATVIHTSLPQRLDRPPRLAEAACERIWICSRALFLAADGTGSGAFIGKGATSTVVPIQITVISLAHRSHSQKRSRNSGHCIPIAICTSGVGAR